MVNVKQSCPRDVSAGYRLYVRVFSYVMRTPVALIGSESSHERGRVESGGISLDASALFDNHIALRL